MINMDTTLSLRKTLKCGYHDVTALQASGIPYADVINYFDYEYGCVPSFMEMVVEAIYVFANNHGLIAEDIELADPNEVDLIIDRLGILPEVFVKDTLDMEVRKELEEYVGRCAYVFPMRTII